MFNYFIINREKEIIHIMHKKTYIFTISLSFFLLLCSCISQKLVHGNLPDAQLVSLLDVGKDNKDSTKKYWVNQLLKEFLEIILTITLGQLTLKLHL